MIVAVGEILISHVLGICSPPICNNRGMSYGLAIREGGNWSFLYQEWSEVPENGPGQRSS